MKYGCSSWKTKNYYTDFSLPETSPNFFIYKSNCIWKIPSNSTKKLIHPNRIKSFISIGLLRILKINLQIKPKILPHVSETYPDTHLEVKALILKSNYFKLLIN